VSHLFAGKMNASRDAIRVVNTLTQRFAGGGDGEYAAPRRNNAPFVLACACVQHVYLRITGAIFKPADGVAGAGGFRVPRGC